MNSQSKEYERCKKYWKNNGSYYVWKQPEIKINGLFELDDDSARLEADSLLLDNEFGWGFSEQGWHTWFTRFDTLKECYWNGGPADVFSLGGKRNLFGKTKFLDYYDYKSHVICFPPRKD